MRTLVHCIVKHSRPPDLKSSSNVSLPFAWITGLATDPSFHLYLIGKEKFTEYPKGCATVSVMSAIGDVTKASTTMRAYPPFFNSVGTGLVSVRATEVLDAFKVSTQYLE